jgi:hypothetical protein
LKDLNGYPSKKPEKIFCRNKFGRRLSRRVKSSPKRSLSKRQSTAVGAWAVVAVDGTPLRKKAQREYRKALRDLDAAKARLQEFNQRDQPLFSRWINQNFGAILTEIRELQGKLFEAQQLIAEVQQEYFFGGHRSIGHAYREVMRRRAEPEPPPREANDPENADEADDFDREFEESFSEATEDFWARFDPNARKRRQANPSEKAKEGRSRLKDLYRTLARRLHPDKATDLTANEKEWWHQTQAAYDSGNLEQMEMILTLVEIEDKGTGETSVSALAKLTAGFKNRLRALKRQLSELRRDAAWNFSQRADHPVLFNQIQSSLQSDRQRIASLLSEYQAQIDKWNRQPLSPIKQARARRRDSANVNDLWF